MVNQQNTKIKNEYLRKILERAIGIIIYCLFVYAPLDCEGCRYTLASHSQQVTKYRPFSQTTRASVTIAFMYRSSKCNNTLALGIPITVQRIVSYWNLWCASKHEMASVKPITMFVISTAQRCSGLPKLQQTSENGHGDNENGRRCRHDAGHCTAGCRVGVAQVGLTVTRRSQYVLIIRLSTWRSYWCRKASTRRVYESVCRTQLS